MKKLLLLIFFCSAVALQSQNNYETKNDIPYLPTSEQDAYRKERCKLDIYYPAGKKDFITIVWFHGGGLEGGSKGMPDELRNRGMAVVAANYRLSPKAQSPAYIDDAAAAVAWVLDNIESFGGDKSRVYVSGHSAGGYLALMIGLDKSYLQKYGKDANILRGLAPIGGQTLTHYTIRKERGMKEGVPVADEMAPLCQVRADIPPTLLITGDRHLEMTARYEENAILEAYLKGAGCKNVLLREMEGFDHGNAYAPGCLLMLNWINDLEKKK